MASDGTRLSVRFTTSSMLPISFAELAKAPANMNISIMSIMFSDAQPRLNTFMRCFRVPREVITATIDDSMNATVTGTL